MKTPKKKKQSKFHEKISFPELNSLSFEEALKKVSQPKPQVRAK